MNPTPQDSATLEVAITIEAPIEHAFRVFVERFDDIKPREHNLLAVPIERTVLEAHVGGTIHDIGVDGSSCAWARILAYEPPHRLVFSWDINPNWQVETDPERASEVELLFVAETPERTRVMLTHRHLDRHGDGWEGFTTLDTDTGWPLYLGRYRALTESAAADA